MNNEILVTEDTFKSLLPFDLDDDTNLRYMASLKGYRHHLTDGSQCNYVWQHISALKHSIAWLHSDLGDDVVMTPETFLEDLNFMVHEAIEDQLILALTNFQENCIDGIDRFEPWQLNQAFARVLEQFVYEEIANYDS